MLKELSISALLSGLINMRLPKRPIAVGVSGLTAILLWQVIALLLDSPLFPAAEGVVEALFIQLNSAELYQHLLASIGVVVAGYALSVAAALPLAVVCFRSERIGAFLLPAHEFIRYIPVPAFVPLIAALMGIGDATKVSLIFIGTYFQVLFLYIVDLKMVPEEIEQSARTLGVGGARMITQVTLPAALPRLIDTSRVTFAWAWSYLLVAEVVNAERGVGFLVLQSYRVLNMSRLVALLVVIGIFGLAVDQLFRAFRNRICRWDLPEEEELGGAYAEPKAA
jgi:NitT/TauT family transport system permease protein